MHPGVTMAMAVFGSVAFYQVLTLFFDLRRKQHVLPKLFPNDEVIHDLRVMTGGIILLILSSAAHLFSGYTEKAAFLLVSEIGFASATLFPIYIFWRWRRRLM